jgi:peptide/nickel transport system substrate-binding protein
MNRFNRRRLLGRLLTGAAALPLAAELSGCGTLPWQKQPSAADSARARDGLRVPKTAISAGAFQPARRGGGGTLKLVSLVKPSELNPHLATNAADIDAARLFTEPLAAVDPEGRLVPVLAAGMPAVAPDSQSVTWRLKPGVIWHDGEPFTADDVVFTWRFVSGLGNAAATAPAYAQVSSVSKIDDLTVAVQFKRPTPSWSAPFTGNAGHILPAHLAQAAGNADPHSQQYSAKPVGTGPYKLVDFKPGDSIRAALYPKYHVANRPFFDAVALRSAASSTEAARSVLELGSDDFADDLRVEYRILEQLASRGIGRLSLLSGSTCEILALNFSDPDAEIDGERASVATARPFFLDIGVRKAVSLCVNRQLIVQQLFGKSGSIASALVYNPPAYLPPNTSWEFNPGKAAQLLEAAGWKAGLDKTRTKDGRPLRLSFQAGRDSTLQDVQAILRTDLQSAGIQVDLKVIDISSYLSSDPAEERSLSHFYAALEMFSNSNDLDPIGYMRNWQTDAVAQKSNGWAGANIARYRNPAFDALLDEAEYELISERRTGLLREMNQMLLDDVAAIPLVARNIVTAARNDLQGFNPTPWDSPFWNIAFWFRTD